MKNHVDEKKAPSYNSDVREDMHLENHTSQLCQKLAVSVDEMAYMISVSRPVAYELAQRKDFPSFKIGKRVLVNVAGLQRWLDKQIDISDTQ